MLSRFKSSSSTRKRAADTAATTPLLGNRGLLAGIDAGRNQSLGQGVLGEELDQQEPANDDDPEPPALPVNNSNSSNMGDEKSTEAERRLVRKLDMLLLPPLWLLYVCNYLDRNNIA
jgi:hypothetical protein